MATQPPIKPDVIEPFSPSEKPADPSPTEAPPPIDPDASPPDIFPGGGDVIEPGRGPDEMPLQLG